MIRALWTAASGMQAQQLNIDVIANNLANVNTAGFKKSRADFQDVMYQNLKTTGSPSTNSTQTAGIQIGLGTTPASVTKIFTAGNITQSGNELDVAIEGEGFYQIQMPDGTTKTFTVRQDVDLSKRSVGEEVVFRFTEAMAIRVEKP